MGGWASIKLKTNHPNLIKGVIDFTQDREVQKKIEESGLIGKKLEITVLGIYLI